MVSHGRGTGRNRGQAERSGVSNRRAYGHEKDQEAAHRGLCGRRISVSGEEAPGRFAVAGLIQRGRSAGSRGLQLFHSGGGAFGVDTKVGETYQGAGIYGKSARRIEPVEHETFDGMAAARSEAGGGSAV